MFGPHNVVIHVAELTVLELDATSSDTGHQNIDQLSENHRR